MKRRLIEIALAMPFVIASAICAPISVGAQERQSEVRYIPPPNLAIELIPNTTAKTVTATAPFSLTGTIKPLVGSPRDLKVFFESSQNLAVTPASASLPNLDSGKPAVFDLQVSPALGKADEGGTFVRLRVIYNPDFAALASFVADTKLYPNQIERIRLQKIIRRNTREKAKQTDAARFFVP
ncbi:MAG: hypothetical protein HQM09_15500 [Candidatus Riflebacteria bacterium]|nr:hypothetical protein [Candidatus Riflebacteria bacterium]